MRINHILEREHKVTAVLANLPENIAQQYREEEIQGTLLGLFAGLAILIACMGLFGLASFTIATVRIKAKECIIHRIHGLPGGE